MKHKAAMMDRYDKFVVRMADRYAEARARLDAGDYVGAQQILAEMGLSHARTSMSLRNVLIRDGLMEDE